MPSCLGKSSYKEGQVVQRKTHRGSFIETIQRKFNSRLEGKKTGKSAKLGKDSIDTCSEKGSSLSDTALPSSRVSHCHCFAEQTYAQPLPLPVPHPPGVGHAGSGLSPTILELHGFSKPLSNSDLLPGYGCDLEHQLSRDAWGDLVTASVSRNSSTDTNDHPDSQLLSPQASDYESGNVTAINSPSSYMDYSSIIMRRILEDHLKSAHLPISKIPFTSTKDGPFGAQVTKLQITPRAGSFSAPHSYISSPARSPGNASAYEQVVKCGSDVGTPGLDVNLFGSGHCCNLGSEKLSEHNPVSDRSFIRPQSECSPEYSPVPSPRITSHVQSESVASLHPGRSFTESPMDRSDDGKSKSHKLPLPPATACNSFPFSFSKEAVKTPTPPRNHCRPVISTSPVPRWKKGRLIGSGTFGQVYMGFNSETGEMCAMKEVALFSDDSKSKESAQQLRKEITLLSRLKHPNIVEYFDSEMVDNKLHIYLEYVSGGSIYKILREYGELGESAIRSYARQILSGLAYLHSKNTAHRDIKGANILVDPSGQVKLADFGMAKQITGESCLLSFKGSPYWMAPEVIKNSNGCSFAVDIWSLGCTVIEMATTKPPWSQYEGVAALFKIGNSKELPAAPDHLSKEGKDFVLECLQRNPRDRPTAVQLLGHPFVRNAASPERCLINQDPPGSYYIAINAKTYKGMGHAKTISSLDLEGVGVQSSRGLQTGSGSSSPHMSEHTSCPVSPIGSPLLHPKSSQPRYSRRYPTISSPQTACGSSTPCSSGKVAFPVHHLDHSMPYPHEVTGAGRPQRNLYANGSPLYCKRMLETVSGIPEVIR